MGEAVLGLTGGRDPRLAGMSPGDLTVTVGIGPRLVRAAGERLPGADDLPRFPRERMTDSDRGGDVMVQLCASDPLLLPGAAAAVSSIAGLTERWRQAAFRGPNVAVGSRGSAPRNLLGFVDGIVVPRGDAEYARDVWLPPGTPVAGGTIAVVRRMEIDVERFLAHDVAAQERIIGRRRASAAPLSGGTPATNPDLGAKTPDGAYVIPADAHLRRANPVSTGVPTMLRRSYSFADAAAGLLFVSFQNDLHTFVATLNRMSTSDALLEYTTTTRSGTFLVLPGFGAARPLGASLFG
jgi:dye decolorizing peroxidase